VFVVEHGLALIEAFVTAFDWSSRAVPIGVGKVISLPTHVVSRYPYGARRSGTRPVCMKQMKSHAPSSIGSAARLCLFGLRVVSAESGPALSLRRQRAGPHY
jgi:hypothetical protein